MAMCYRDRTYCVSPNCQNKCGSKLTDLVRNAASKWWLEVTNGRESDAPICMAYLCDEHGEVKP